MLSDTAELDLLLNISFSTLYPLTRLSLLAMIIPVKIVELSQYTFEGAFSPLTLRQHPHFLRPRRFRHFNNLYIVLSLSLQARSLLWKGLFFIFRICHALQPLFFPFYGASNALYCLIMALWATKRKVTYLSIALSVLVILAAVPISLSLYRPPTCLDGRQNQGEDGVDCGGPCQLLCKSKTLEPIVLWQRFFKVSPGVYNAVAYVQNPNVNSAAYNVPYVFRLYDARNLIIYERKGITAIAPRVTTPVFESGI